MTSDQILMLISGISIEERSYLTTLMNDKTEEQKVAFLQDYNMHRKDPMMILILTLIGFGGIAGIQRFLVDDILIGILYLLTCGFCFVGTIIDLVRYKEIAFRYNRNIANMVAAYTIHKV